MINVTWQTDTNVDFAISRVIFMPAGWDFPADDIRPSCQMRPFPGSPVVNLDFRPEDGSLRIAAQDPAARTLTLAFGKPRAMLRGLRGTDAFDVLLERAGTAVKAIAGTLVYVQGVTDNAGPT